MATLSYSYPGRKNPILPQLVVALVGGLILFLTITAASTVGYQLIYAGRIFPGVSVAGVDVSGMSPNDAALKLSQTLSYPMTGKILFRDGDKVWVASPAELGMSFNPTLSAMNAYQLGRAGGPFAALAGQVRAQGSGMDVAPVILFDQKVAYQYLQNLSTQLDKPVVEASLRLDGTNVVAQPGQVGRALNLDATLIYLGAQLQAFRDGEVQLVVQDAAPKVLDVSAQADNARRILSQPLQLVVPNYREGDPGPWVYDVPVLANMLTVQLVNNGTTSEVKVGLDPVALRAVLNDIKPLVDRNPENARFIFNDDTRQLEPIQASKVGRALDVEASTAAINDALLRGDHTVPLSVAENQPAVPDTAAGEGLGITQLVGEYTSYFYGSSEPRIQNIQTASSRFHGVLVAPGEIFSMGQTMGDVSLDSGFAEALIIYGGRTIKGVGGGVCQVSTTLFRAVFNAGYPVNERYSHAYRVQYYEMTASGSSDASLAGLDATVYFPVVDFKFTNDTPYWLLMETYVNVSSRTLTWKLYSTSDDRSVTWETTGPQNVVPAPEPLFEVNPELGKNEMKVVDYAANGADIDVTRTVWRNGQVYFTDNFKTQYEPWQAVCEYGPGTEDPEKIAKKNNLCHAPSS